MTTTRTTPAWTSRSLLASSPLRRRRGQTKIHDVGPDADGKSVLVSYRINKAFKMAQAPVDGGAWQPFDGVGETDEVLFDGYTDRLIAR